MKDSRQQPAFRPLSRPARHARAFSLYDALVALAVVSTVSTVAVPSYQQLITSQRMSTGVNTLVTALHMTRSEAIKQKEQAVLCPSPDGHACQNSGTGDTVWEEGYLLFIDRDGDHEFDVGEMAVRVFGATEGLYIRSSAHRDHVTYQPDSRASGSNLSFTFCDRRGRGSPRTVIVSNSGRPRTSTRNASGGAISCPTAP